MPLRFRKSHTLCAAGFAGFTLAACDTPPSPTVVSASGATEIRIASGLNCYDNKCFKYDPRNGSISVTGRRETNPPAGVSLASGAITPAEFNATFEKGMTAKTIGGDNR